MAPATYKRVSSSLTVDQMGRHVVFVTYDAHNAFGVPIRSHETCTFAAADDGELPGAQALNSAARDVLLQDAMTRSNETLERVGAIERGEGYAEAPSRQRPQCCLAPTQAR
jgi:hypothetical protein